MPVMPVGCREQQYYGEAVVNESPHTSTSPQEFEMHVQIVNFQLKNMDEPSFRAFCDEVAPAFAALPGLIGKIFLADPITGTFGGVYTWENREAYEAYTRSELFQGVASHPNFTNITSRDFGVLEAATRVTRGLPAAVAVVA